MKEIIEYTITTDDPEVFIPLVNEQIAYGYHAGYVDSENNWDSKVIGYIEEEEN